MAYKAMYLLALILITNILLTTTCQARNIPKSSNTNDEQDPQRFFNFDGNNIPGFGNGGFPPLYGYTPQNPNIDGGGGGGGGNTDGKKEPQWFFHWDGNIPGFGGGGVGGAGTGSVSAPGSNSYVPGGDDTFVPNPGFEIPNPGSDGVIPFPAAVHP